MPELMAECSINEIPETPPPAQGSPAQTTETSDDIMTIDDNSNPVIEVSEVQPSNDAPTGDVLKSSSKDGDTSALVSVNPISFYGSSAASVREIKGLFRPEPEPVDLSFDDLTDGDGEEKMVLDSLAPVSVQETNRPQYVDIGVLSLCCHYNLVFL
jgi:hypothetical protein